MTQQPQHIADSVQLSSGAKEIALQGLYEPSPFTFTFETVGWSILLGVIVLILMLVLIFQVRKYIHNRYRREAIQEMEALNQVTLSAIFTIIKGVAIQVFGREQVGALHGGAWLIFLEKSAKGVQFTQYETDICLALYADEQVDETVQQEIISNAKKWILTHAR
ncbi:DUF4381 domain-containing protein [Reichenbachiella agarivorans]|uniref:DUF4381 domain-containing protein n=1 Tax=Reichenbachiella agarivorans TaxID=2979464 RepID=A0ABY6CPG6_9BACT|nr:DUF4381 domain-containing protein [Reichenbachiella agarivorans]UXP31930.1 DUF4381 domain-containing protein [Reichenbachiella agarivorans]